MAKKSIRPELMQLKTPLSDGCLSVNVVSGALIGARLPGYQYFTGDNSGFQT